MTLTLTLTPEKETRLSEKARAAGLSLDDYVQRMVDQDAGTAEGQPRTGADLIALWDREGVFLTGGPLPDAPALARQIREQAQRRGQA